MKKFNLFLLSMMLLTSCQDAPPTPVTDTSKPPDVPAVEEEYTDKVTTKDIGRALGAFALSGEYGLRSSRAMIYSVDSLKAKDGSLTALVINFIDDGGFILLSPTKTYYPVLAFSDKGHFDVNVSGTPVELWADDMSEVIGNLDALPADTLDGYRRMWQNILYDGTAAKAQAISPHSPPVEEPTFTPEQLNTLYRTVYEKRMALQSQGYRVYSVEEYFGKDRTSTEYMNFAEMTQNAIYPLYASLWEELSLIVYVDNASTYTKENLLETEWTQTGLFNLSFPYVTEDRRAYAGCGPIAIGQVMYYHKYPTNIPWTSMVTSYGNKATSDFLFELAEKSDAKYLTTKTTTDIRDLQATLQSYGYICDRDVYSVSKAIDEINHNRPVILFGLGNLESTGEPSGHGWIGSGTKTYRNEYYNTYYTMTEEYSMSQIYQEDPKYVWQHSIYMNWGWGGTNNGFYLENGLLTIPGFSAPATNRKMIYVRKP